MIFYITNKDANRTFPGLNLVDYYKVLNHNGADEICIDLKSIEDIINLDSVCHIDNEYFTGLTIEGNFITLNEGRKYIE